MPTVAVTGTPGSGKTTLCGLLAAQGHKVIDVQSIAAEAGAVAGHDALDDADVIDIEAIEDLPLPEDCYVDGHLSHYLAVDEIWIVRCDPDVLRPRMEARGYTSDKIQENWEAECMDLVLLEALDMGVRVVQRDGTRRSPEELLSAFMASGPDSSKDHDLEAVDWSDRLLQ